MTDLDQLATEYLEAIRRGNLGRSARLQDELDNAGRAHNARLTAPGALGNAAAWYARQGIPVFPCTPRAKTPATRHGLHDASTDLDQIAAWWRAVPDANIGAPTGHQFDVVDIDGREGVQAVYMAGDDGQAPIDTIDEIGHAITPRQAGHHLFIAPTGRGNTTRMLPGVDYRGVGGYVLLAPSVSADGGRYVWTRPLAVNR